MTTFFFVVFWFCVISSIVHLFWAGVVAPALRVGMRFKLFAIRDSVRFKKLEALHEGVSLEELNDFERFVNNGIYLIDHFGIFDFVLMNADIQRTGAPRKKLPEGCENLAKEVTGVVVCAAAVNSLTTFLYLVPLVYFVKFSRSAVTCLLAKPERELADCFPRSYA